MRWFAGSFRTTWILLLLFLAVAAVMRPALAQDFTTRARTGLLVDADTGTVLFAKEPDERIQPASMAKLMTMEVVFDALKNGHLNLTDTFHISEDAWRRGGAPSRTSTMFAEINSDIALEDLIRGVVIQSANDACIAIAQGMAGSEAGFAQLMNKRAAEIGMTGSYFTNSTGLPDPEEYVTISDLAKLARHIIREYPEYFRYYSEEEFTWNKITQRNRNPLLNVDGGDGMATGYTEESGYAIVGTAKRADRRLITVLSGMASENERAEEARKILDWGTRAFEKIRLFEADEVIGEANVYGGEKSGVPVVGKDGVDIYLPIGFRDKLKARIVYMGPLMPPIVAGSHVATLKVWIGDRLSQETPLYAAETIEKGGLRRQAFDAAKELLFGWIRF